MRSPGGDQAPRRVATRAFWCPRLRERPRFKAYSRIRLKSPFLSLIYFQHIFNKSCKFSHIEREGLRCKVHFLDCPVSGGPRGASAGSLTCMLGSDSEEATKKVLPVVKSFAQKARRRLGSRCVYQNLEIACV